MAKLFREGLRGDGEEACEVVGRGLDRILENVQPVAFGGAPARDGGDRSVLQLGDFGRRSRRVERDLGLDLVQSEEIFDLRESLRMRPRDAYSLEARAAHAEQAVANADDDLGDDLRAGVLAQEVVHVGHRSRMRVLNRHDRGVHLMRLERGEYLGERAARHQARAGKQRCRGRLRECAGEALVGDGGQRYTAVRHSECRLSSPCAMPK